MNFDIILLQTQGGGNSMMSTLLLVAMVVIFWLFFIRPQTKKAKEEKNFIDELEKGMNVVTKSGVIGKISKIDEKIVTIQVDQKTHIPFTRGAISKELTDGFNSAEE